MQVSVISWAGEFLANPALIIPRMNLIMTYSVTQNILCKIDDSNLCIQGTIFRRTCFTLQDVGRTIIKC